VSCGQTSRIDSARIDQWLHAVRLASTRSEAAAACRAGHVRIGGRPAKPASTVTVGDRVEARIAGRDRIVDVTAVITRRVGAAIAVTCYEDHSPPPPEREPVQPIFAARERGSGRPAKRERRQLDRLRGRR
jgi:ribosome-associated heat shock protein Hsp15